MLDRWKRPENRRARRRAGVLALLGAALVLRMIGLGEAPYRYETVDEMHYMWTGLSLLTTGKPTSWSWLRAYEDSPYALGNIVLDGRRLMFVSPALDHPPLYSLLAGAFAKLVGADPITAPTDRHHEITFWWVSLARVRLLSVGLFAISFLLLYDLAARRWGYATAMTALLLYSTVSHIVLHGRLIVTETLSVPLFLASLCAWERFRTGKMSERAFGWGIGALSMAAILTKLVAACQPAAIVFLLLVGKRRRAAIYPILGLIAGFIVLMIYARAEGWDAYWLIQHQQSIRFSGFDALQWMISRPLLVHTPNYSAPIFLGWLALPAAAFGGKRRGGELLAAAMLFLTGFTFFVAAVNLFGWHQQPFYPFMVIALAACYVKVWRRLNPVAYCVVIALLMPAAFDIVTARHLGWILVLRWIFGFAAGGALLLPCFPSAGARKAQRAILMILLAAILTGEAGDVIKVRAPMPPERTSQSAGAPADDSN